MGEQEPQPRRYTPAEYFALEEQGQVKHEYFEGEVFAMAGSTKAHNDLALNFALALKTGLRGSNCRTQTSDVRVVIEENTHYVYPDVVVSCDPDDRRDPRQVSKPVLIVEVLSASTAMYDRIKKFEHYRTLSSLRYYVLVHQDRWLIEWFHRTEADEWVFHSLDTPAGILEIPELKFRLSLTELYDDTDIAPLRIAPPTDEHPR